MLAKRIPPSRQLASLSTVSNTPASSSSSSVRPTYAKPPLPIVRLHQNLFETAIYAPSTFPVSPSPPETKKLPAANNIARSDQPKVARNQYALQGFKESEGFAKRNPVELNLNPDGTIRVTKKGSVPRMRREPLEKDGGPLRAPKLNAMPGKRGFSSSALAWVEPRVASSNGTRPDSSILSAIKGQNKKKSDKTHPPHPRTTLVSTAAKKSASIPFLTTSTGSSRMDRTRLVTQKQGTLLEPGCWVEARSSGAALAVGFYLGPSGEVTGAHILLSGSTGEIVAFRPDDVTFVIPPILPPSLTEICKRKDELKSTPELDDAVHQVVQSLRGFEGRVEECTKILVARGARDIYPAAVQERTSLTAQDALSALGLPITGAIASKIKWEYQLAMHRLLMDDPLHFLADPASHRVTGKFTLRLESEVAAFDKVRSWSRERTVEITGFAERAAKVREWGAKHQPKRLFEVRKDWALDQWNVPADLAWRNTDLDVIQFLRSSLEQERELQPQPYLAVAPSILKLVDRYSFELYQQSRDPLDLEADRTAIMKFLSEIGSAPPWENWSAHGAEGVLLAWDAQDPLPRTLLRFGKPSRNQFSIDQHDSVRRDFGKSPVYTIDDPGAMELDDGISLEEGPPTDSGEKTWWIHVHVADPTAILHPGHEISIVARARQSTEYFPEKTFKMLPEWVVRDNALSLGSEEGRQQKVLTLSTRIDELGNVLDGQVNAGIIRVVKRVTYEMVNQVLGITTPPSPLILSEPRIPSSCDRISTSLVTRKIDDEVILPDSPAFADLSILYRLSATLLRRRVETGALVWQTPSPSVFVSPTLAPQATIPTTPIFYRTSPLINLHLPPRSEDVSESYTGAQTLVSELMVLANRTAAKFCVEKEIPLAFRSQADPVGSLENLDSLLQSRDPDTGSVTTRNLLKAGIELSGAKDDIVPGKHFSMGIQDEYGYTKMTSPLRRYSDLFGHWQIKSALLPNFNPSTSLPFSRLLSRDMVEYFGQVAKARGRIDRPAKDFWILYVLEKKFRALRSNPSGLEEGAEQLLTNLTCLGTRIPTFSLTVGCWTQRVFVIELGMRAQLITANEGEAIEIGEVGNVRIRDIVLGSRSRLIVEKRL